MKQFMQANVQTSGLGFGTAVAPSSLSVSQAEQIRMLKQKKGKRGKKAIRIQGNFEQMDKEAEGLPGITVEDSRP